MVPSASRTCSSVCGSVPWRSRSPRRIVGVCSGTHCWRYTGRARTGRSAPERRVEVDVLARAKTKLDDPSLYVNRELALLAFQERVLEEAVDPANPLLERAKYLAIFSSNLAEFYMVRVAGLKQQIAAGVSGVSDDGLTAAEQLAQVRERIPAMLASARQHFEVLRAELAEAGIALLDYAGLNEEQRAVADAYFESDVFPVLTPLAFDPGRPFPHISNLSMNIAIVVTGPDGEERFARVKVPKALPRLVPVTAEGSGAGREHAFVWLDQLVVAHAGSLFPGYEVVAAHPFRITRDAEMVIQELEADDLLETIEQGIRQRRFGSVVRMTVEPTMPDHIRDILVENLDMDPADVITIEPPLGMSDLFALSKIDRPDLKYATFVPALTVLLGEGEESDIFTAIRERDILLHHPYESFQPVVSLIRQAAHDPDVLAIKMTLYRVGTDSPIVEALIDAAVAGKEVACLVELKARFDEESNIEWARALEAAGVHVVYGLVGLKTHSKVVLVVRREGGKIRRYVHVGTGNYNTVTAMLYTDLGLLTCDEKTGEDASALFNLVTGYARKNDYRRFLVAPVDLRERLSALINREIEHAQAGRGGRMILKMNSLVDQKMIRLLYEASQAGVDIDLLVRGVCCLRPGVSGISENIRVWSVVGRFLEHSRIYYFANNGDPDVYIGSADLMPRNLDRRVEVLAPVRDSKLANRLRDEVLEAYLRDTAKTRAMRPDGTYERVAAPEGEAPYNAQEALLKMRKSVVRRRKRKGTPQKRKSGRRKG
ncbi:MAG: polyphosphate kinase 1 [Coriobacteriia bacterium]|nr:polyphosphate kinase 1 [Coriobacteriia bacterium]